METGKRTMKGLLWIAMSVVWATVVSAQDPSYRPKLLWHLGATGENMFPQSFTEEGDYLLCSNNSFAQVYSVDHVLDSQVPLGRGLISYDLSGDPVIRTGLVSRTETSKIVSM